jgi:two-component system, OmpR family, sensor histidine kinase KdpD
MATRTLSRPDPEELLRRVESEERELKRGRLKVFLGYAPHVGKSRRMFDEGCRRKSRGQDVVVGALQTKDGKAIEPFLRSLPVIPLRPLGGGLAMDLDAILKRQPGVCLVDELAYDNPPGALHEHRWQDVEHLLDQGINVVTAVNLQHIAEQQDRVTAITSKRTANSVPEKFIRDADEIEIVDVPVEDLCGDVSREDQRRLDSVQLCELRELALLLVADVIEAQLLRYLDRHGIQYSWGAQERILLCLEAHNNAKPIIESGKRNADRSHGHLFALHVQECEPNREQKEQIEEHLDLARRLGAEVHVVKSSDVIGSIIDFARANRITQVFVGHPRGKKWLPWREQRIDRLIREAEGMDVRIFPQP